jgi:predicted transcriptional regulator
MPTIQIELADDVYQTLEHLARENETDPTTLVRTQIERLVTTYRGAGLTPGMQEHLATSIDEHRTLLQRLAE